MVETLSPFSVAANGRPRTALSGTPPHNRMDIGGYQRGSPDASRRRSTMEVRTGCIISRSNGKLQGARVLHFCPRLWSCQGPALKRCRSPVPRADLLRMCFHGERVMLTAGLFLIMARHSFLTLRTVCPFFSCCRVVSLAPKKLSILFSRSPLVLFPALCSLLVRGSFLLSFETALF